jgi:hypothetical protein
MVDCVMSYIWVVLNNELERCVRKQLSPDVKYCPGMYLEELGKLREIWVSLDIHWVTLAQDSIKEQLC